MLLQIYNLSSNFVSDTCIQYYSTGGGGGGGLQKRTVNQFFYYNIGYVGTKPTICTASDKCQGTMKLPKELTELVARQAPSQPRPMIRTGIVNTSYACSPQFP